MRVIATEKPQYIQSPFKKGKRTCPVCGKTSRYNCSITIDGSLALCKYKWSERQSKDGRYKHILTNLNSYTLATASKPEIKESEPKKISADKLDAV